MSNWPKSFVARPSPHAVIVGLGNPGKEYEMTRHNMGFLAVQAFGHELGARFKKSDYFESRVAHAEVNNCPVDFLLPQTYMNDSGRAVHRFLAYYDLRALDVICVVDDLSLPFGQFRIRSEGSSGGHNGLKSVELALQTKHYLRLRIGIGKPAPHFSQEEFVLGHFTSDEKKLLPECIDRARRCLKKLLTEDIERVAGDYNRVLAQKD